MDKELVKNKIKNIVTGYKKLFPEEYNLVVKYIEQNRKLQANEFATLKKDNGMLHRALYEIPEKLNSSIFTVLNSQELDFFKTKECSRWFTKTFKEFSLAEKI